MRNKYADYHVFNRLTDAREAVRQLGIDVDCIIEYKGKYYVHDDYFPSVFDPKSTPKAIEDIRKIFEYIKKGSKFDAFGETTFNGTKYMLVRQGKSGDILMVNEDGELFNRIGRIVDGRLAVLDIVFFPEPEDIVFTPVVTTRSENTDIMVGWELRYDGVVNNYMRFTYSFLGSNSSSEEFIFPVGQQTINIYDLRINVIEAGYNKIEYVIL